MGLQRAEWDPNEYQGRSRAQVESSEESIYFLAKVVKWAAIVGLLYWVAERLVSLWGILK